VGKRTVGIFSNYNASEKTFCALYLAEHILCKYRHVIWIVPDDLLKNGQYYGFSHKWDEKVLSLASQSEKIESQLKNCEIFFFFEENEQLYSLLPETAKTILFLDPYNWNHEQSRAFASKCTHSFASSPYFVNTLAQRNLLENVLLCPFDHCLQMIPRVGIPSGRAATLFYPAYGTPARNRGAEITAVLQTCIPTGV
jgi:hypothetical protein